MGAYSDAVHNLFVELAMEEMDHVTGIQTYLGRCIELVAQPVSTSLCAAGTIHALRPRNCLLSATLH